MPLLKFQPSYISINSFCRIWGKNRGVLLTKYAGSCVCCLHCENVSPKYKKLNWPSTAWCCKIIYIYLKNKYIYVTTWWHYQKQYIKHLHVQKEYTFSVFFLLFRVREHHNAFFFEFFPSWWNAMFTYKRLPTFWRNGSPS